MHVHKGQLEWERKEPCSPMEEEEGNGPTADHETTLPESAPAPNGNWAEKVEYVAMWGGGGGVWSCNGGGGERSPGFSGAKFQLKRLT